MGASSSFINKQIDDLNEENVDSFIEKLLENNPKYRPDVPNYHLWSLEDKKKTIKLMIQASGMYKQGGKRSRKNRHNMRKSKKSKK
jgi:hypothetical protein